jgi:hypothetical protein
MKKPEIDLMRERGASAVPERSRRGRRALIAGLAVAGSLPLIAFACTNAPSNQFPGETDGAGGDPTTSGSGSGGSGGGDIFSDGGLEQPVTITPFNPVLKLELPLAGQAIQFECKDTSSGMPVDATWTISSLELGTISDVGLFTPNGKRTGSVTIGCQQKNTESKALSSLKVLIHAVDNVGAVTPQQIDVLRGPPGLPDPTWKFLYPYDETVFPRGILAPEIHMDTGSFTGNTFAVSIIAPSFEYEGYFNTSGFNTQLQMSQAAWEALSNAAAGTKVEVRVSKLSNNQKYGPIFRRWTIADGKLHGTIYYNTYDSPLAGNNGAMMRIKGNSPTAEVLAGNCTVCHSVGADGSTAAAAGGTFDLTGGNVNPPLLWQEFEKAAFAGIYPKNGEVIVIHGAPGTGNTPGTGGQYKSELRTKNGTIIPSSGIEGYYAQTPAFAHDGTMLAFTDRSPANPSTSALALMLYDSMAQKFSSFDVLATPKPGRHLSWPAFTPDSRFVVYQDGTGDDLVTWNGNQGRIFAIDIPTKQIVYLSGLNGDGYMPQGARDENKNYEPTIAPVASGGYFWVMFTSRRTYGNKLTGSDFETKRLWVSALSINPKNGVDFSHPAFYVSGQELTSGNSRGFWALDPCKQTGTAECETGDECCEGFCNPTGMNPPKFMCGPPDGSCSEQYENCSKDEDCCNPQHECINNVCTYVPPQ